MALSVLRTLIKWLSLATAFSGGFLRLSDGDARVIHTTKAGIEIVVERGKKGPRDFRVRFRPPGGRLRTPSHIHLIVEMYVKHAFDPGLTLRLRDRILEVFNAIQPIDHFPPRLQLFKPLDAEPFTKLDQVGEFTAEFILAATELIMIQEKTNYPAGSLTQRLYEDFGVKDRFSVIQGAVFRGPGRLL